MKRTRFLTVPGLLIWLNPTLLKLDTFSRQMTLKRVSYSRFLAVKKDLLVLQDPHLLISMIVLC